MVSLGGGSYQRVFPDGSTENFTLSDGTNIYMTSVVDPQGNAATISYDSDYRITGITDASGNSASFTYISNSFGNPGFYKLASISDAFGRSAQFAYDSTTTYLTSITDAAGNESKFSYETGSFINLMTTPYGSTSFYMYTPQGGLPTRVPVGLKFTFPDGSSSVIENWIGEPKMSYFWDRNATALYPNDPGNRNYTHCKSTRWLWNYPLSSESAVPNWTKEPLEAPLFSYYPGETSYNTMGTSNQPTQVSRQLAPQLCKVTIGGTVTVGDQLGISTSDGLVTPGFSIVFPYKVQTGDTLSSIAAGLAAAVNADPTAQGFGMTATSSAATLTIKSQSSLISSYANASSGSPTETITFQKINVTKQLAFQGTLTTGSSATVTVFDSALPGGQVAVSLTAQAYENLPSFIEALALAINSNSDLQALGVTAYWTTLAFSYPGELPSDRSPVLYLQSYSPNNTTYSFSKTSGSFSASIFDSYRGVVQSWNYLVSARIVDRLLENRLEAGNKIFPKPARIHGESDTTQSGRFIPS